MQATTKQAPSIGQMQNGGEQVAAILNPVRGYRDALRRKGVAPRDHAKENAMAIRSLERAVQQQIQLRSSPVSPEGRSFSKYSSVQSRLSQSTTASRLGKANVVKQDFLRRTSKGLRDYKTSPNKTPMKTQPRSNQEIEKESDFDTSRGKTPGDSSFRGSPMQNRSSRMPRKEPVPKARELNSLAPRATKNFVNSNVKNIAAEAKRRAPSARSPTQQQEEKSPMLRKDFGRVPAYLKERKEKWMKEAEIRRQNLEDDCPPGMVRVGEEERLATLAMLQEKLEATQKELQKLPLLIETVGQRRRKAALDKQFEEQEEAVRIFSNSKVFVQDQEN